MIVRLFTPGPTAVPESVREAEALPMIHHRSPEFSAILDDVRKKLSRLVGVKGETLLLASSGTGGMEASVASLFQEGDEVVVVVGGKFGERWRDLAKHYGLKATIVNVEWGRAVTPEMVESAVTAHTKGILVQACESSTGAYHPIPQIASLFRSRNDILIVVDAITALGVHDIDMDRDRIDVLIGGSQKALMCAPGLATVALSSRALDRVRAIPGRGFYLSLQRELKNQQKATTAFTPAISLVRSLQVALNLIEREGVPAVFQRHALLKKIARDGVRAMGLEPFNSDADATHGLTAVRVPASFDVKKWLKILKEKYGLWLAGGQGELEGKIFRLAHMGACTQGDLVGALDSMKTSLSEMGGIGR